MPFMPLSRGSYKYAQQTKSRRMGQNTPSAAARSLKKFFIDHDFLFCKITSLVTGLKRLISAMRLFISRLEGFIEGRNLFRLESLLAQRFFAGSGKWDAGSTEA
jgi:hypothetical protein